MMNLKQNCQNAALDKNPEMTFVNCLNKGPIPVEVF